MSVKELVSLALGLVGIPREDLGWRVQRILGLERGI